LLVQVELLERVGLIQKLDQEVLALELVAEMDESDSDGEDVEPIKQLALVRGQIAGEVATGRHVQVQVGHVAVYDALTSGQEQEQTIHLDLVVEKLLLLQLLLVQLTAIGELDVDYVLLLSWRLRLRLGLLGRSGLTFVGRCGSAAGIGTSLRK
jgi:hypothetical protein